MEVQLDVIEVTVNGQRKRVPSGLTVAALLEELKVASDRVAIEMNKLIVRKRDWPATTVEEGSHIEVIEFVGGG